MPSDTISWPRAFTIVGCSFAFAWIVVSGTLCEVSWHDDGTGSISRASIGALTVEEDGDG